MSKFNLKNYQKINGDQHIDSRLSEEHSEAPNVVNEKQLDDYRGKEPNFLTEEQLEKSRASSNTKEATEITERRLDNAKEEFGVKQRNSSAYKGDLNKLEEQRLKANPTEDEEYKESSSTPKGMRWWEMGGKSPDGLKLAQKKSVVQKVAQSEELKFDKPRFEETFGGDVSPVELDDEDKPEEELAINPIDSFKKEYEVNDITDLDDLPDFNIDDNTSPNLNEPTMYITKEKDILGDIPAVYMVIGYSVEDFNGDELAIKQSALDKVLSERPELKGIISVSDFGKINEVGDNGEVSLRSVDERLSGVLVDRADNFDEELSLDLPPDFEEVYYDVQDINGTPMASGEVSFDSDVNDSNRRNIIDGVLDFIEESYGIEVSEDSLDLSGLEDGSVKFLIEAPAEEMEVNASVDFPVLEVTAQGVKRIISQSVKKK